MKAITVMVANVGGVVAVEAFVAVVIGVGVVVPSQS